MTAETETGHGPATEPAPDLPATLATRAGFAALIGAPNAGKSTLVNKLVGTKISIVTHKVQTTRTRLRGIVVKDGVQLVLVDTPGIFAPKRRLDRAMVHAAWSESAEADITALLVDAARGVDDDVKRILGRLGDGHRARVLVLNKVDKVEKPDLLALAQRITAELPFDATFMISATTGSGVAALEQHFLAAMPPGPWLYPEDQIADATERHLAAEVTREKMLIRLHDELPYVSTVETTDWKRLKDGSVRIEQTIFVERDSQKKIVLGHGGATIKSISMDARKDIAAAMQVSVHLFLFVKVRSRWGDDPERYREMGLEFPDT
jgi:GTPase